MKNTILLGLAALSLFSCQKTIGDEIPNPPTELCPVKTALHAPEGYSIESVGSLSASVFSLEGFQFVDENTGFAMSSSNTGGFVQLFKTVDGGKNWSDLAVNIPVLARSMAFRDENFGLISVIDFSGCPNNCLNKCTVLKTETGGNSWTIVEYPNLSGFLNHLQFDEEGRLFAMLNLNGVNTLVRSDDGGASFQPIYQGPGLGFAYGTFSFKLFQDKIYASGSSLEILVLDKAGNLIKKTATPLSSISDLNVIDENNLVAAFSGGVLKSKDGGNSWKMIFSGSARLIDFCTAEKGLILKNKHNCSADFYQANDLFAVTNDGGETWLEPEETTTNLAISYSNSQKMEEGRYLMFLGPNLVVLNKN